VKTGIQFQKTKKRKDIMKYLKLTLCLSLLAGLPTIAILATAGPIEIPANAGARLTAVETTLSTATGNVAALQAKIVAQADTNETSDATLYTPRFVGDTLVGGAGAGTSAVWIAKGATTNDWVAIKP
jgi:hypothetical protein